MPLPRRSGRLDPAIRPRIILCSPARKLLGCWLLRARRRSEKLFPQHISRVDLPPKQVRVARNGSRGYLWASHTRPPPSPLLVHRWVRRIRQAVQIPFPRKVSDGGDPQLGRRILLSIHVPPSGLASNNGGSALILRTLLDDAGKGYTSAPSPPRLGQ